jgi:MoaA/NifB/PqqE/SkfB family radical SAM enzyme
MTNDVNWISKKGLNFYRTFRNIQNEKLFTTTNILRALSIFLRKPLIGPLRINIDITDKCDMGCGMCRYHSPLKRTDSVNKSFFLPLQRIQSLAREVKSIGTKVIMLAGEGEPLLHPCIEEIVEILRSNSLEVEIITNAYYLNKERIDFFKQAGLKKVTVSMHAPDAGTFLRIRPGKAKEDFEKIMDNLLYLKSVRTGRKKPNFFVINVISALNCNAVAEMVKLAESLEADKIIFKPLVLTSDLPESLKIPADQVSPLINTLKRISLHTSIPNNIGDYVITLEKIYLGEKTNYIQKNFGICTPFICYNPFSQSVIDLRGNILGCVYAKKHVLGNIYESSFPDIWFSRQYNEFRKSYYCPKHCLGRAVYPLLI